MRTTQPPSGARCRLTTITTANGKKGQRWFRLEPANKFSTRMHTQYTTPHKQQQQQQQEQQQQQPRSNAHDFPRSNPMIFRTVIRHDGSATSETGGHQNFGDCFRRTNTNSSRRWKKLREDNATPWDNNVLLIFWCVEHRIRWHRLFGTYEPANILRFD